MQGPPISQVFNLPRVATRRVTCVVPSQPFFSRQDPPQYPVRPWNMFRRPPLYHPYKPSVPLSPAGLRLRDFIPRRCFNLFQGPGFTTTRSPDPSPLNSPVRGMRRPEDEEASPTTRLADIFASHGFASPTRPSTLASDRRQNANVPVKNPLPNLPIPPRRKVRGGPKHLSFRQEARRRSGPIPVHRRSQQLKDKRDALHRRFVDSHERHMIQARDTLVRLRKEAEKLMKPEQMNDEDHIFLRQLRNLDLDQKLEHDLEQCRLRVARAAQETEQRGKEHEARDAETEKLWREQREEDALEEQRKKVNEFVWGKDGSREGRLRRMEEEAMRADEKRQRTHEAAERRVREEQERFFREELDLKAKEEEQRRRVEEVCRLRQKKERQEREERERRLQEQERRLREEIERVRQAVRERLRREEQERQLREEVERLRRQARERLLREEQERVAREEQERQERLRAEEEQIRQYLVLYEAKWNELRTNNSLPPIDVREMPWPVFGVISSADHITHQGVRTFLFHPQRPGVEGKTPRDKIKAEVLRFHPDKFNTRTVPKIQLAQQALAQEIAGAITRILTSIMKEVEQ